MFRNHCLGSPFKFIERLNQIYRPSELKMNWVQKIYKNQEADTCKVSLHREHHRRNN